MSFYAGGQSLMETALELCEFVEAAKTSPGTKEELVDSLEHRLSLLVGKLAAVPTSTSFCLFGSAE